MKLKNNLILLSTILFFSCSSITKIDIEEENKNILKELEEKNKYRNSKKRKRRSVIS